MGTHNVVRPLLASVETAGSFATHILRKTAEHAFYGKVWDGLALASGSVAALPMVNVLILTGLVIIVVLGSLQAIRWWRTTPGLPRIVNTRGLTNCVRACNVRANFELDVVSPHIEIVFDVFSASVPPVAFDRRIGGHVHCNGTWLHRTPELDGVPEGLLEHARDATVKLTVALSEREADFLRLSWNRNELIELDLAGVDFGVIIDPDHNGPRLRLELGCEKVQPRRRTA